MMKKNVFIMALDDYNLGELRTIRDAEKYNFHSLLDYKEIVEAEHYPVKELLEKAETQLKSFDGSIDAIIGYWDFPVTTLVPILCERFGLPGPSPQSVVKCTHKYWSRLEQEKCIPECTPQFNRVDPFDEHALEKITIDYPFWIKPVQTFGSQLGFKINNADEFREHIQTIREGIHEFGDPYDQLLEYVDMPPEVTGVGGNYCLAEQLISGREVAPEGYSFRDETHIHGIIDMIREKESFLRLEYPSRLPEEVQKRASDAVLTFIRHIGFNNGCFNVEFFWNEELDKLWIIEINARISQSHSNMFEKVDGTSNHEVAVDVALGQEPRFKHGQGEFKRAAKCWIRRTEDAIVTRVPGEQDIQRLQKEMPGLRIYPDVEKGMRLSDMLHQDSYSYAYAITFIGAQDQRELEEKYEKCTRSLGFEFEDVEDESAT